MANLLWRGHPVTVTVTVWQLKAPGAQPDVLLPDLQHCRALHHPSLLLLTALSPSADPSGLCLLFEPVWLGPREGAPALCRPAAWPPAAAGAGGPAVPAGRWHAPGGLSSHAVQLMQPGLAKVGTNPGCGPDLYSFCILAQEVFTGQRVTPLPAPVRPPPFWVPQSCFLTRELPRAGREGPELETGESPALDPLVPAPYQALVRAGLGLGPADHWGSLPSTQYPLRKAMAQDSASEVSSPMDWTTLCPSPQGSPPEPRLHSGLCPL
ncbi:uncharacterized protein LOC114907118 isoform X2 [Monodon monoceros]|uniref:uncharacterized protein LOC114907118 isoform X2 n=1 Tax=Monodon monoceros TaxID=40151 RepID=UPI0010F60B30|nr:uncharacterized protein LOC114907118 isoform X2 [Monodon monoceros]